MRPVVATHNEFHLGDNLIALHLLRALAAAHPDVPFIHFTHLCHAKELLPLTAGLPNLALSHFECGYWEEQKGRSINTWKNAEGFWEKSPQRWNWPAHTLEHHAWTARRLGFPSPFQSREDLLFDYPALDPGFGCADEYEFLVVNSRPCSGQLPCYDSPECMDDLILALSLKGRVLCTQDSPRLQAADPASITCAPRQGMSVSAIGHASYWCRHHLMVATAPMWPTLNAWNHDFSGSPRLRVALLHSMSGPEQLNMPGVTQLATIAEAADLAAEMGLL